MIPFAADPPALLNLFIGDTFEECIGNIKGRHVPLISHGRGNGNTLAPTSTATRQVAQVRCCRILESVDSQSAFEVTAAVGVTFPRADAKGRSDE